MGTNIGTKDPRKSSGKREEPFSLNSTLDQYEVQELDAREIANLINEPRRRKAGSAPPAAE